MSHLPAAARRPGSESSPAVFPAEAAATLRARAIAPAAAAWLATSRDAAAVLHLSSNACALVDARGEVLVVATARLGGGPFAVTVELPAGVQGFAALAGGPDLLVRVGSGPRGGRTLRIGPLGIELSGAHPWDPRPRWAVLRRRPDRLAAGLPMLRGVMGEAPEPGAGRLGAGGTVSAATPHPARSSLLAALAAGDPIASAAAARDLAGRGPGLTPSEDDFIVGALCALWATRRSAAPVARSAAAAAAPRTTTLSAAFLRAAARGELPAPWHDVLGGLARGDDAEIVRAAHRLLATGVSSGRAALTGFVAALGLLTVEGTGVREGARGQTEHDFHPRTERGTQM